MNAAAPPSPYARMGGSDTVGALVNRFYDLLESDIAYAGLRALHAVDLAPVRYGLAQFMIGWLGGPRDWFDRGQCVMGLHRAFPITPALATQWSDAMARAIADTPAIDTELAAAMRERLAHMAQGMINMNTGGAA